MGFLALCTDYLKDIYLSGTKAVAQSKVKAGGDDYTAQHCFGPGIEINPANGENLVIQKMKGSSAYLVTVGGTNQNIEPDTARGERKIYSVSEDGATIKAIVKFKNDGVLELNAATDSAVKFADLKTAYDELNGKYNKLVVALNTWVVVPGDGGAALKTLLTAAAPLNSTGNIDPAESADIKLS